MRGRDADHVHIENVERLQLTSVSPTSASAVGRTMRTGAASNDPAAFAGVLTVGVPPQSRASPRPCG